MLCDVLAVTREPRLAPAFVGPSPAGRGAHAHGYSEAAPACAGGAPAG